MDTAKTVNDDIQSRIKSLFQSYRDSLPALMADIDSLWQQIQIKWDEDQASELLRKVHGLAGSAATFELVEVGELAREIELTFKPLFKVNGDESRRLKIKQLLGKLKQMIDSGTS